MDRHPLSLEVDGRQLGIRRGRVAVVDYQYVDRGAKLIAEAVERKEISV